MVRTIRLDRLKDFGSFKNQMNQAIFANVSENVFAMMTTELMIPLMELDLELLTEIPTESETSHL